MRFYNTVQSLENVKCGNQENAINVVKGGGWVGVDNPCPKIYIMVNP